MEDAPDGGPAEGSGGGSTSVTGSIHGSFRTFLFLSVLVPDIVAVLAFSPVGLGPGVYDAIATDRASLFGNLMALVSAFWLMAMFVFDVFESKAWRYGMQAFLRLVSVVIFVVMVFVSFTLKSVSYPWVPLLMSMCTTVVLIAIKYSHLKKLEAAPQQFYLTTAVCYLICASTMFVVWVAWVMSAHGERELWWDDDTVRWMADKYAGVYLQLTPDELPPVSSPLPLLEYCLDEGRISGIDREALQDLVTNACGVATTVIFTQWAGAFIVFSGNVFCAGFCVLFSNTIAKIRTDGELQTKKRALITFMKRFLLTIVFAVGIMYSSLYVSGAAAKLASAMMASACIATFVMFLWLAQEVDMDTLNQMKEETPIMRHVINILQSNWMRAMAVGGLNVAIPFMVFLDRVRQLVRQNITDFYHVAENGSEGAVPYIKVHYRYHDRHTPNGERLVKSLEKWDWTDILGKVCVLAELFKDGSVGIWAGLVLACIAGSAAKMMACVGQYSIGYFSGKSVKVQQFVGVTKVSVLATEAVLKEKGFKLFKVCILVAGPDFPTSVLCGILNLNIPQILLGTSPVILVSIIPQTLVGVLMTKENATEGLWAMIATVATGLAAAFQAGATLVFAYGILKVVEESGDQLVKTHRPEHDEVRKLAEKEADFVQTLAEVSDWSKLGTRAQATLLGTVALFLLSGLLMVLDTMAAEKICFRNFALTNKITDSYELGGLDGNVLNVVLAPMGWVALGLAAIAVLLHVRFGKWLKARAAANVLGATNPLVQASAEGEGAERPLADDPKARAEAGGAAGPPAHGLEARGAAGPPAHGLEA
ncbi:unnamed protein product, partial [Prorocentrum cordatum]